MMFGMTSFRVLFRGYYKYCECGCKILIKILRKNGMFRRFKKGHHLFGSRNPNWIGGILEPDYRGYNRIRINNKYIFYHRWVYEQYYKVCLLKGVDIDHINGIKTDNRIENLRTFYKKDHTKYHKTLDKSNRFCRECKRTHEELKHIYKNWYGNEIDGWLCNGCYKKWVKSQKLLVKEVVKEINNIEKVTFSKIG